MSDAIARAVARFAACPFAADIASEPWDVVARLPDLVRTLVLALPATSYRLDGDIAIHREARVEPGAELRGPLVVGPHAFIAATACVRGGAWLDAHASVGRGCELNTALVFEGSALAHFNYVGDSIIGAGVNLEAGSIVCNHRNESPGASVHVRVDGRRIDTGRAKFGALIGDGCRIGANAVLAPGTVLSPGTVVARLALIEQDRGGA